MSEKTDKKAPDGATLTMASLPDGVAEHLSVAAEHCRQDFERVIDPYAWGEMTLAGLDDLRINLNTFCRLAYAAIEESQR